MRRYKIGLLLAAMVTMILLVIPIPAYASTTPPTLASTVSVGSDPLDMVVSPNGNYAYVANDASNSVSVVSTATNTVVDTVAVGLNPTSIAISPNGDYAYVTNSGYGAGTVSIIDTSTNTVTGTINIGANSEPNSVAISSSGSYAYVLSSGANSGPNTLSVVDLSTNAVVTTINMGTATWSTDSIILSSNGDYAYVATTAYLANDAYVIDTSTNAITDTLTSVSGLAASPSGNNFYVSSGNTVSVIDASTNAVLSTIAVNSAGTILVSSGGQQLYVVSKSATSTSPNTVSVISTSTDTVIASVSIGSATASYANFISAIALSPNGDYLYVTNANYQSITSALFTIDLSSYSIVNVTDFGNTNPYSISVMPSSAQAYVLNNAQNDISALSLGSYYANTNVPHVSATIPITSGASPGIIGILPNGDYAYVAGGNFGSAASVNTSADTVSVINTSTNSVVDNINVGYYPSAITVSPNGDYVYVGTSNGISVINTSTNTVIAEPSLVAYENASSASLSVDAIALSPHGKYLYVANTLNYGSGELSASIAVMSTSTNTFTSSIDFYLPYYTDALAVSPNGEYIYAVASETDSGSTGPGYLSVFDIPTGAQVAAFSLGSLPDAIALSSNGSYAYITNSGSNTVDVVDTSTNAVADTIDVGSGPDGVAMSPNGSYAYVTSEYSFRTMSIIDTATNTVVAQVYAHPVGIDPQSVAVSSSTGDAYIPNEDSANVSVVSFGLDSGALASISSPGSFGSLTMPTQSGPLSVSDASPSTITATVDGSGSGSLPSALWGDATGTGDGWQGTIAASNFIYTGKWSPLSGAPALSTNTSGKYTGTADGDAYTVKTTSVSGSTIGFSYISSNGATGTGTATAGTAASVGSNGLTITFSTSSTYSTGDEYQIHVGAQNASALVLYDLSATVTPTAGNTSPSPAYLNTQATVAGAGAQYGSAVTFLSAALGDGMGSYTVTPDAVVNTDVNSWQAVYVANIEYSIATGPAA